jgi:hypothetical protein
MLHFCLPFSKAWFIVPVLHENVKLLDENFMLPAEKIPCAFCG